MTPTIILVQVSMIVFYDEEFMIVSQAGGNGLEDTLLSDEATLLRFVALDEATSFILLAVGNTGGSPLVEPETLLFISRLRSARLERPRCAAVRELSNWKGETVVLYKGERFEFELESVCPSN